MTFCCGRARSGRRPATVDAGTSETMAGPDGAVTNRLVALYETLARNRVGVIFTGHLYCHPRGQYARRQTGVRDDGLVAGLRRIAACSCTARAASCSAKACDVQ